MSLSISRHSDGSITYCDAFDSDDDFIQGTSHSRRHTSLIFGERELETSTPKIRLSHPQLFGKENISVRSENRTSASSDKQRRSRALETLSLENQSGIRNGEKPATSQNRTGGKKNPKRETMSFEIFRPDDEGPHECSFHGFGQFNTPVRSKEPVSVGLLSPEYEPQPLFDRLHCKTENESFAGCGNEEQAEQLVEMFPNADPMFLRSESERMNAPLGDVVNSILSQMEKSQIPTKESSKKSQESDNKTKKLSVVKLLKIVPDPWSFFSDKGRDCSGYSEHSLHYLKTKFRKFYNQTITDALLFHNHNLYLAYKYLKKKNRGLKLRMTNRPMSECNACKPNTVNLQFLFEVSFIEHEEEVKDYIKTEKAAKKLRLKEARRLGLLAECECCFGENLLPEDVVTCSARHTFCKDCIIRYTESSIENGIGQIECLGPCSEEYPLRVMQEILTPKLFSKLMETYQPADDDYLAKCPFCFYIMFLPPEVTTVTCLNVQCLKESCRMCKGPNHEPMKCKVSTPLSSR